MLIRMILSILVLLITVGMYFAMQGTAEDSSSASPAPTQNENNFRSLNIN